MSTYETPKTRVVQVDKNPFGECLWTELAPDVFAIKVPYCSEAGEELYAVFIRERPFPWPKDLESSLRATGQHLTLKEVNEWRN